jgi:hypothetical protein
MNRLPIICIIGAMTALQALGAGSAPIVTPEEQVAKQESPAVTAYNQGVELMKG